MGGNASSSNSSNPQRPHFSNPYSGHLRPPSEIRNADGFYDYKSDARNSSKHVTIGSLPFQNKPEFTYSSGRSKHNIGSIEDSHANNSILFEDENNIQTPNGRRNNNNNNNSNNNNNNSNSSSDLNDFAGSQLHNQNNRKIGSSMGAKSMGNVHKMQFGDMPEIPTSNSNPVALSAEAVFTVPYAARWSVLLSDSVSPMPRIGHFCCTSNEFSKSYIGYGKKVSIQKDSPSSSSPVSPSNSNVNSNSNNNNSNSGSSSSKEKEMYINTNELWEFDHLTMKWKLIVIKNNDIIKKREEAAAVIDQNTIYVFGGKNSKPRLTKKDPKYYSDLHTIDINTGVVNIINNKGTTGSSPPGLSGAFISFLNGKIYIYGGYDGKNMSQYLYCFDLRTKTWTNRIIDILPGRCNASSVMIDGKLYVYGGLKGETSILVIDLNSDGASPTKISGMGLTPIPDYNYGRLLKVKDHLFYFGGKANNRFTLLYAYDISRNWWFVFNVLPDNETVTLDEGKINDNGFFLLPRIHSFGCCFEEKRRAIVAFLGHPLRDPPPLFMLSVGEAFGVINLRNDMLDVMKVDFGEPDEDCFEIPEQ